MTTRKGDDERGTPRGFQYDTTPTPPRRTVDRPDDARLPTPEAVTVLRALLNVAEAGRASDEVLESPHLGDRFSQRQLARKVLAGRSYQAVQGWINGEPVPKTTAEWLTEDLQRVDARAKDRMVRVLEDEIAIVVKR